MMMKQDILNFSKNEESKKNMLLAINQVVNFTNDKMTHSDMDFSIYKKTSGVTTFETKGENFCNSN